MRFYLVFLVCLIPSSYVTCVENTTLELVQIVFRHGDRTPIETYPNNPHNATFWDSYGGLGQLTTLGIEQMYEFGQFVRQRYTGFLNENYHKDYVTVKSTDKDRTLMSAQALLASLFTPTGKQVWSQSLHWQPVPVHTTDYQKIFTHPENCDLYKALRSQERASELFKNITRQYSELLDEIRVKGGYSNMTLEEIWKFCDDVFVEKSHNFTLPKWIQDNYDKIMDLRHYNYVFSFRTIEMAKLVSGMHFSLLDSALKIKKYQVHDTFVAGLTKLLNLTSEIRQPPYASAVIIELRKSVNSSQYYVQTYLKDNQADEKIQIKPMPIFGCEELCPIEKYDEITKFRTVENYQKACSASKSSIFERIRRKSKL